MKDPASDFFLKHQPLEYYKCHLHTVLEKEKEGGLRLRRKERGEPSIAMVMKQKVVDWDVFISVSEWQRCDICLIMKLAEML